MLNSTILLYKRRKKLKFEAEIGVELSWVEEKTQKKWYGCLLVLFFWRRIYTQQSSPYFQFFKKWYAVKIWTGGQVQKKVFFNNLKAKDTTRFHCLVGSPPNHFLGTFLSKWLKLVFTQRSIVKKRRHYTQHPFYMIWLLWISSNHRSLFLNWTLNAAGLVGSAGVTLLLLSLLSEHGGFGRARQSFPVAFAATGSSHSKPFQGLVKTGPTFDGMLLLLLLTLVTHHLRHGWGRWSSAEFLG